MRLLLAAALTLLAPPILATPSLACGPDSDCTVLGNRTYRYYMPDTTEPVGAFFHAHGYRGSADGAMNNAALRALADRLNMAFIALNADADDWSLAHRPAEPGQTDAREYDYVAAVIEDVATRITLDRSRLIATGFSAGGMMTWTLACGMSDRFAGFVPHSGTFWAPVPATCDSPPATVIHIHGNADTTVPLEGRAIGATRQGSVPEALGMYNAYGDFAQPIPVVSPQGMRCVGSDNPTGQTLMYCEFDGGHSYSVERVEWAIEQILDRL